MSTSPPKFSPHADAAKRIRADLANGSLSLDDFRSSPLATVERYGGAIASAHRNSFDTDVQTLLDRHAGVDLTSVPALDWRADTTLGTGNTASCVPCEIFLGIVIAGVEIFTALAIYGAVLLATGAATEGVGAVILAILESDAYWTFVGGVIMATAPEIAEVLCVHTFKCSG